MKFGITLRIKIIAQFVVIIAQCELGKWIHSAGAAYKHLPEYLTLKSRHALFHSCCAKVLTKSMSGDKKGAQSMLDAQGEFSKMSSETVGAIMALKKAIGA